MSKKPKIKLVFEENLFPRCDYNLISDVKLDDFEEDKICKIQKLADLTKTKHVMNLTEQLGIIVLV